MQMSAEHHSHHYKYKVLIDIGITILSEQYATCIIGSLLIFSQCHLSTIEASAWVSAFANVMMAANPTDKTQSTLKSAFSIVPKLRIQLAVKEYDHIHGNANHQTKTAKEYIGVALMAQSNSNGGKSTCTAKNGKLYGICWNCKGKHHVQNQCLSSSSSGLEKDKS
jgi:hypothetical protein